MQTIHLDPDLVATIETLPSDSIENVEEAIRIAANDAARMVLQNLFERRIDAEQAIFQSRHSELVEHLLGKYIAMHQGEVIDSDTDERTLYMRVYRRYPNAIIAIFPVKETSELTAHKFIGGRIESQVN